MGLDDDDGGARHVCQVIEQVLAERAAGTEIPTGAGCGWAEQARLLQVSLAAICAARSEPDESVLHGVEMWFSRARQAWLCEQGASRSHFMSSLLALMQALNALNQNGAVTTSVVYKVISDSLDVMEAAEINMALQTILLNRMWQWEAHHMKYFQLVLRSAMRFLNMDSEGHPSLRGNLLIFFSQVLPPDHPALVNVTGTIWRAGLDIQGDSGLTTFSNMPSPPSVLNVHAQLLGNARKLRQWLSRPKFIQESSAASLIAFCNNTWMPVLRHFDEESLTDSFVGSDTFSAEPDASSFGDPVSMLVDECFVLGERCGSYDNLVFPDIDLEKKIVTQSLLVVHFLNGAWDSDDVRLTSIREVERFLVSSSLVRKSYWAPLRKFLENETLWNYWKDTRKTKQQAVHTELLADDDVFKLNAWRVPCDVEIDDPRERMRAHRTFRDAAVALQGMKRPRASIDDAREDLVQRLRDELEERDEDKSLNNRLFRWKAFRIAETADQEGLERVAQQGGNLEFLTGVQNSEPEEKLAPETGDDKASPIPMDEINPIIADVEGDDGFTSIGAEGIAVHGRAEQPMDERVDSEAQK
ncbi:hypothetical protein FVE85_5609 [Porphyridium purpureum]|uniref:THO complex subunit 1 n=1 Tax=Porphyridium purpureum TaxID=35688 RepID=A0A5J4Z4Z2_PORPP|nr:hypothetical protein FVE85_5609 [Porphyridium purpureum]|eukprot:POR9334..scf295_1